MDDRERDSRQFRRWLRRSGRPHDSAFRTPAPCAIWADHEPGKCTLRLRGDLDLSCVDLLADYASGDLDEVRELVVDLHDLEFLDVAGLRALLAVCSARSNRGRTVTLVGAQRQVRRLFALVGQDHRLSE